MAGDVVRVNRISLSFEMWDNPSDKVDQNTFNFFWKQVSGGGMKTVEMENTLI